MHNRDQAYKVLEASMLVIGDEILGGFVQDTNSHWLAGQLMEVGVPLSRVSTVPDTFEDIAEALATELARARPRVIVTSGGVGSTPDDITFEAVAAALGQTVREEPLLRERIDTAIGWAADLGMDMGNGYAEHMLRMCRIPEGGRLLGTDFGWVPGIAVDVDGGCGQDGGATIVILPGVPSQFQSIITGGLRPELLDGRNADVEVIEIEHGFPESALNPCFASLVRNHPEVKLGSYPGNTMLVRLIGPPEQTKSAAAEVRTYLQELLATDGGARMAQQWTKRWRGQES